MQHLRVSIFLLRAIGLSAIGLASFATNQTEDRGAGAGAPITIIPLDKQYVPVIRDNRTVMYKTAYFGNVFIGFPEQQKFTVVFDSGSGHFIVPSSKCNSETCRKHRRFDHFASHSALALDHDGNTVNIMPKNEIRSALLLALVKYLETCPRLCVPQQSQW